MARPNKTHLLELDKIIEAAWKVVDRDGIAALSTRNVAAELNVKSPALYWHVKSKQELLSLMIDQALRESMRRPSPDLPWWEWLREYTREQRRIFLAHRDSGLIAATAPPSEQMRTEIMPRVLAPMLRAGIPPVEAAASVGALAGFVLGAVIYEQSASTRELILEFIDPEISFETGLNSMIEGLRQKAEANGPLEPAATGS